MSIFQKKQTEQTAAQTSDASFGTAADVEEVMKKYDRESNTRVWEGVPKQIIRGLMAVFSVYSIYVTLFSTALPEIRLSVFLGSILIMGYLNFPMFKHHVRPNSMPWYDAVIMVLGAGAFFYYALNAERIIKLSLRASRSRFCWWWAWSASWHSSSCAAAVWACPFFAWWARCWCIPSLR